MESSYPANRGDKEARGVSGGVSLQPPGIDLRCGVAVNMAGIGWVTEGSLCAVAVFVFAMCFLGRRGIEVWPDDSIIVSNTLCRPAVADGLKFHTHRLPSAFPIYGWLPIQVHHRSMVDLANSTSILNHSMCVCRQQQDSSLYRFEMSSS